MRKKKSELTAKKNDLSYDFGRHILYFAELESRERYGEIGALLPIVDARIHLFHSKSRKSSGNAFCDRGPERVKNTCGGVWRRVRHSPAEYGGLEGRSTTK